MSPAEKPNYTMVFSLPECNLFCTYCRKEPIPLENMLTDDEILEMTQACVEAGIKKVRWTGGEPTVRKGFVSLVQKAKEIGIEDQMLSTNGTLLHKMASELRKAGLRRLTISLDTFDKQEFYKITGKDLLDDVLYSIEVATEEFDLVKLNSVLVTDDPAGVYKFIDFAAKFPKNPPIPRFIELVKGCAGDIDTSGIDFLTIPELINVISEHYGTITPMDVEGNNPIGYYHKIEKNNIIFGILPSHSRVPEFNPKKFKTLRISPTGYISNCARTKELHYLRDLVYTDKVKLIKQLVDEKSRRTSEYYEETRFVEPDYSFWRFGK